MYRIFTLIVFIIALSLAGISAHAAPQFATAFNRIAGDGLATIRSTEAAFVAQQDGAWHDASTWGGAVPAATDSVSVPTNIIVSVERMVRRNAPTDVAGQLIIYARITNSGEMQVNGVLDVVNGGSFINANTATLETGPFALVRSSGTFSNRGLLINNGQFQTSGHFINRGSVTNYESLHSQNTTNIGTVTNHDHLLITGAFDNVGSIDSMDGTLEVACDGLLTGAGALSGDVQTAVLTGVPCPDGGYGSEFVTLLDTDSACDTDAPAVDFQLSGLNADMPYMVVVALATAASLDSPNDIMMWREFTVPAGHSTEVLFSAVLWNTQDESTLLAMLKMAQYNAVPFDPTTGILILSLYDPATGRWLNGFAVELACNQGSVMPAATFFGLRSAVCYVAGVASGIRPECTLQES